jgi:hypothetical protein
MNRAALGRLLLVLLTPLLIGAASAQTTWGVRVDVELPVDESILAFVADPLGYASGHRDVVDARAFVEFDGRFGFEGRYRSATEVFAGAYYNLSGWRLFGQSLESSIGLYAGRDFRADSNYLSLRGTVLLFGRLP